MRNKIINVKNVVKSLGGNILSAAAAPLLSLGLAETAYTVKYTNPLMQIVGGVILTLGSAAIIDALNFGILKKITSGMKSSSKFRKVQAGVGIGLAAAGLGMLTKVPYPHSVVSLLGKGQIANMVRIAFLGGALTSMNHLLSRLKKRDGAVTVQK